MLKKFTVSDYRIFGEPITIDFSNVRDYKFNEECISNNLITKAILYGKNATGKTNLGYALLDIRSMVLANKTPMGDEAGYINAKTSEGVAQFTYYFLIEGKEIIYKYEKYSLTKIKYEELSIDGQMLYRYNFSDDNGDFSYLMDYEELKHLNFNEWDNETPVFRYIISNAKLKELLILKEMSSFVGGMAFLRPLEERAHYFGPKVADKGMINTIIQKDLIEDFTSYLNNAGINIKLKKDIRPDGETTLYFDFPKPIDFIKNMSSGTRALTSIYIIMKSLEKITFLFIDELDANLHFSLSESILESLKKNVKSQILITTHNTDLMSNKIMRPDCYLILTPNKIVSLTDATTRELREGHNLEKLYQSGEFDEMVSN